MSRCLAFVTLALCLTACAPTKTRPRVGVAFETLQTEYWVASRNAIAEELNKHGIEMIEAIADGDAGRQYDQVGTFLTRQVDGIILVHKDADTVIPMVRRANRAGVPFVIYNRQPAKSDTRSITIAADNYAITCKTVEYLAGQILKRPGPHKAAILIGDLGDINAIGRRDGFEDTLRRYADRIQVVARIPTEWNQEKTLAGISNALQANQDIDLIFTSSDVLLPSIVSALKARNKYLPVGAPGHIVTGGFDGDATAYRMLREGYLDADGVQDVYNDSEAAVQAILDARAGKPVLPLILDAGFVLHQGNLTADSARMWGSRVRQN